MLVLFSEKRREKVDKCLAILHAKLAPDGRLAAVAVVGGQLRWPRVHSDRQRYAMGSEQVGQGLHIAQGANNAAFDPQWRKSAARLETRKRPADPRILKPFLLP